jgi:hypothetical protein
MTTPQQEGRCTACGALLDLEEQLEESGLCSLCEDERAAEEHHDECDCEACDRARSRFAAEMRRREALHCGGLSSFGREVLGWVSED